MVLNPLGLVEALSKAGIAITVVGDKLRVEPSERLTDSMRVAIRLNKPALLQLLASTPLIESTRATPSWCHQHRFGYRDTHGSSHCLTCKPPTSPDTVAVILEFVDGLVVQHDPWLLPDDGDAQEFVCERAAIREFDGGFDRITAQKLASLDWWRTNAK